MPHLLIGVILLFFSPGLWASEIMFEGFYRIELNGAHIGYMVQRYDFDSKKKQFGCTYFRRLKIGDKIVQESLQAKSNEKLKPISYKYTAQDDKVLKTIDATFSGPIMTLQFGDGKKMKPPETHQIPKDTFLSSFLMYLLLHKKMVLNEAYQYSAVAEEEGASYWGKVMPTSKETKEGYFDFKMLNSFKVDPKRPKITGEQFIAHMGAVPDSKDKSKFIRAEILSSSFPAQNITAQLVSDPNLATEGQIVPNKILLELFGNMPMGRANLLSQPPSAPKEEDKDQGNKPRLES